MKSFFSIVGNRHLNRDTFTPVQKKFENDASLLFYERANVAYGVISSAESDDSPDRFVCFDGYIANRDYLASRYSLVVPDDFSLFVSLFNKLGLSLLDEIDGAFCFAVINKNNGEVTLARDRAGIKPLYWGFVNQSLVFSSRLRYIIAYPAFEKKIDLLTLGVYLKHGYYHYPATVFENLYKLPPATCIRIREGRIRQTNYWDVAGNFFEGQKNLIKDYPAARDKLGKMLESIVETNTKRNIKYGSFLSGGADSSILAAILQKQSSEKIETFTIGFADKKLNEAEDAKAISAHIGANHNELYITIDNLLNWIDDMPYLYDEPFGDSSQVPTSIAVKMAKQKVDCVFAGDGSDELFGGYEILRNMAFLSSLQRFIPPVNFLLKATGIYPYLKPKYKRTLSFADELRKTQLINPEEDAIIKKMTLAQPDEINFPIEKDFAIKDLARRRLLMLQYTSLVGTVIKIEQPSAYHDMHVVFPFLSRQMVEFSNQLPTAFLLSKRFTKIILKDLLADYVPRKWIDKPKQGFAIPALRWLKNEKMRGIIDYYRNKEFIIKQGIFNHQHLSTLINEMLTGTVNVNFNAKETLWRWLTFQIWYDKYMK